MNALEMIKNDRIQVLNILNEIYDPSISYIIIENIVSNKKNMTDEINLIEKNYNKTNENKVNTSLLGNNFSNDFIYIIIDGKLVTISKNEVDKYGLSKIRKL